MKHLRVFETETAYDSEVSEFEYPTVSFVQDIDDVRYMVKPDYSKDYLIFEALEDGTFTLTVPASIDSARMTSVSYSTDNGETWTDTAIDNTAQTITTPTITSGSKVLWKGVGNQMSKNTSNNNYSYFSSTGNFNVRGNIMSLLYGDDFQNNTSFNSGSNYNFSYIFKDATKLTDAVNLILPATTLTTYCYSNMFSGCTSLATAPALPATTLATNCYRYMFQNCSNLNYIKAMFTTTPSTSYTNGWVRNVAATGTFVKNSAAEWDVTGVDGVPSGWTVETASA